MSTFIILSRFSPQAFDDPRHFPDMAEQVSKKIKTECPNVRWKESYATLGRFDVVDIVEAEDPILALMGLEVSTETPGRWTVKELPGSKRYLYSANKESETKGHRICLLL